jgi:hypothetical protein
MGISDSIELLRTVLYEAGRADLYGNLLEIHEKALEYQEDNRKLREEIAGLKELLRIKGQLRFTNTNAYIQYDDAGNRIGGPFCACCWDRDHKLINLHYHGFSDLVCPVCKNHGGKNTDRES